MNRYEFIFSAGMFLLTLYACQSDANRPSDPSPARIATATNDTLVGFKGVERSGFEPLGQGTYDYLYQGYTIRVTERSDTIGHAVTVARHAGGPHFRVPLVVGAQFYGKNRDFLYMNVGTGPNQREVIIYDMLGQRELFRMPYVDEPEIVKSTGKFWYFTPVAKSEIDSLPDCPDAQNWEQQGFQVGYAQRGIYDPVRRVRVRKSEYICYPIQ